VSQTTPSIELGLAVSWSWISCYVQCRVLKLQTVHKPLHLELVFIVCKEGSSWALYLQCSLTRTQLWPMNVSKFHVCTRSSAAAEITRVGGHEIGDWNVHGKRMHSS